MVNVLTSATCREKGRAEAAAFPRCLQTWWSVAAPAPSPFSHPLPRVSVLGQGSQFKLEGFGFSLAEVEEEMANREGTNMQTAEEKTLQRYIFNILLFVCQKNHDGSSQLNQKIANRWAWRTMEGVKSMLVRKLVPKKRGCTHFYGT